MYIIYVKNIIIKTFLSIISIHFCIYFKEYYQVKSNAIFVQHFGFNIYTVIIYKVLISVPKNGGVGLMLCAWCVKRYKILCIVWVSIRFFK